MVNLLFKKHHSTKKYKKDLTEEKKHLAWNLNFKLEKKLLGFGNKQQDEVLLSGWTRWCLSFYNLLQSKWQKQEEKAENQSYMYLQCVKDKKHF